MKEMFFCLCLTFCAAATLLGGCMDEEEGIVNGKGTGDLTLTLKLDVPKNSIPETRGMASGDESTLNNMKILVFKNDGGTEKYAYTAYVDKFTSNSVTVKLIRSTASEQYRLVLLANVNSLPAISANEIKAEVLKKITVATTTNWPVTGNNRYIPMWGESGLQQITDNTNLGTVNLLRALAKVDVDCSAVNTSAFQLKHVYVYNSSNKAYAAPLAANVSGYSVTAPSIPSDAAKNSVLTYNATGNTYASEIYLAEAVKGSANTLSSSPCLVIGGSYNSGAETYYRVDFIKTAGSTDTYLDILRNKQYNVKITKVSGNGYDTKEKAFNARAVNMSVDITAWDASGMTEVAFDGQYTLGVSQTEFTVDEFINYVEFMVNTTYEGGYTLELPSGYETFIAPYYNTVKSNTGGKKRVRLLITPNVDKMNRGRAKRSAKIYVTAGKLRLPVTIRQEAGTIDMDRYATLCPHSNCYMIPYEDTTPMKDIVMSVQYKGESRESVGRASTVELLWEKSIDLTFGMIRELDFYDAEKKYVKFKITRPGNALIGVKDGSGNILWSWHIWVPASTYGKEHWWGSFEGITSPSQPAINEDGYSMPMNLGAMYYGKKYTNFDSGAYSDMGCLYQWGRKDPFPFGKGDTGAKTPKVFTSTDTPVNMELIEIDFTRTNVTPEYVTAFPDKLFRATNSSSFPYWLSSSANYYMPDGGLLWGGIPPMVSMTEEVKDTSVKTIYDPSPFGWKVPNIIEFQNFVNLEVFEYLPGWMCKYGWWIPKNSLLSIYGFGESTNRNPAGTWLSSTPRDYIEKQGFFLLSGFLDNSTQFLSQPAMAGVPVRPVIDNK